MDQNNQKIVLVNNSIGLLKFYVDNFEIEHKTC